MGGLGGANSASYYINDPFGHSSKEVLYNTLHCSHHMPAYPRKGFLGRRMILYLIFVKISETGCFSGFQLQGSALEVESCLPGFNALEPFWGLGSWGSIANFCTSVIF